MRMHYFGDDFIEIPKRHEFIDTRDFIGSRWTFWEFINNWISLSFIMGIGMVFGMLERSDQFLIDGKGKGGAERKEPVNEAYQVNFLGATRIRCHSLDKQSRIPNFFGIGWLGYVQG